MAAHKPSDVIKNYNVLLNKKITLGYYQLNALRFPTKAYATFANVLEFEPENVVALSGRLTSLIYLSTLRKSYFKDVIALLNISKHRFHLISSKNTYTKLLSTLNSAIEEYHHNLAKRLTNRGYFYDSECLKLFVKRLQEIKTFKEFLQSEFISLDETNYAVNIAKEISVIDKAIHADLYTTDGIKREFNCFDEHGNPTFNAFESGKHKPLPRYRLATLNKEQKGMRIIPDSMFNKNKNSRRLIMAILLIGLISDLGAVAMFIISGFIADNIQRTLLIVLGIALILCSGIFIAIFSITKKIIKVNIKKKHLSA
jgi:hypothetical protein